MGDAYRQFLEAKLPSPTQYGFAVERSEVNPILKPHQIDAVLWAVAGGRRALFESFGLGKTVQQLEIVRLVLAHCGGRGLIVTTLGIRQEFIRDAVEVLGWAEPPKFIRRIEEAGETGIYLTNYETVRDRKLDPRLFSVASLDEAQILRGFGGTKTFREFMGLFAGDLKTMHARVRSAAVQYRFVATATPSPNDYIELLAYAAFLGVMDVSAAKTRFFKRDSTKADQLTIHPHKEAEFWLWVSSWALFVQKPSDLGYSDEGYALPELDVRWHEIPSDHSAAGAERDGQGKLFKNVSVGVTDASREKRESLQVRVAHAIGLICHAAQRPGSEEEVSAPVSVGVLPPEEGVIDPGAEGGAEGIQKGVLRGQRSAASRTAERARARSVSVGPEGEADEESTLRVADEVRHHAGTAESDARGARVRVRNLPADVDQAGGGSSPRHEGRPRNPVRPLQYGVGPARGEHGHHRTDARVSEHFQAIIWCDLNDEQQALERGLTDAGFTFASLYGSQPVDERADLLEAWRARERSVFVSKPVMYGAGINMQQCQTMVFAGINYKFSELIQAVHRIYRFGQTGRCTVTFIYTEAEREIRRDLERKWDQHKEMTARMTEIIKQYGLSVSAMAQALTRSLGVERVEVSGDGYRLVNNDSVLETKRMEANSVGLILTSIPFSTQYEYSPNYADFGHTDTNEHFFKQMDFLTPELLRVLQPGRVAAIHVKDRIVPSGMTGLGFQTVYPFHARCIEHYTRHGFGFLGMKTIVTDVVRENNQTYRLGWTEQCKDGTKMGAGMPEYLLLFRKPPSDNSNGYADLPVVKSKARYTRSRWQIDAHGFTRSSGNRALRPDELENLSHEAIFKLFREYSLHQVYDFEYHVALAEAMEAKGTLPVTFMLLQPASWHPDVWTDITRMLTLNGAQSAKGKEMHLCPMQFDLADRVIEQFSMPGEVVLDPFGGLMTVPYRAIKQRRRGVGIELSSRYFLDGAAYCEAAAREMAMPDLFAGLEASAEVPA